VTGSIWGKAEWGVWWKWDPRLTTTFVLWLVYAAYVVLRMTTPSAERSARFAAVYAAMGFVTVPLVFVSIRIWTGLHPDPVIMGGEGSGLAPRMRHALLFCVAAFTLLYFTFLKARFRLEQARRERPWGM